MEENVKLPEHSAEPCLICGIPTTTLHLQVNACRACASFFRRSLPIFESYRCQKNNGTCDITLKSLGKPLCKYCRYQKCVKIGMKVGRTKVLNNDVIEKATFQPLTQASLNTSTPDFEKLFEAVNLIFQRKCQPSKYHNENYTKQFANLLENFLNEMKPQKHLLHYLKNEPVVTLRYQEKFFVKTAELLNNFQPFASLDIHDKLLLFKKFWEIFCLLEKCYQSCIYFGNDPNDLRAAIYNHYIDMSDIVKNDIQHIKNETDKIFLVPILFKYKDIFYMFKKANITLFELSYMCQIALWSCYDILGLSETTLKVAEEMTNKTANDMHEYFIQELRMPYYATRQSQLFKIVHYSEFIFKNRKQMHLAKGIFNFGNYATSTNTFEQSYYNFVDKQ